MTGTDPNQSQKDLRNLTNLEEDKVYAALCYVSVLVFVPLLTRKQDPFINFHIRQGLLVLVATILSLIVAAWQQWLGNMLFLLIVVVDLLALVQTLQGKSWKIPGLGSLAEKIKI